MFQNQDTLELKNQYESGKKEFQKIQLRRADLRGIDLQNADFSGADLSYANLRDANLSGTNFSEAYLNEADLTGANLQGANLQNASLIKTYLIKANLEDANLEGAYLTGAYATKSNFRRAHLQAAYLNGAKLCGTNLEDAFYDDRTHFDTSFEPIKAGMKKEGEVPIQVSQIPQTNLAQVVETFNYLSQISNHYLGKTVTAKYWETARPNEEWLKLFEIDRSAQITVTGDQSQTLTNAQLQPLQLWARMFIGSCCAIIQNFPKMLDTEKITWLMGEPTITSLIKANSNILRMPPAVTKPFKSTNDNQCISATRQLKDRD